MQITEAKIFNFGKIQNKAIQFHPGINIVYGRNEAGKTTLHSFLVGMLFGMEKGRGRAGETDTYTRYEPWHAPSYYSGALRFNVEGKCFYLERNFYTKEKRDYLRNEMDGEELSVAYGDLQVLLGGITKETFGNTYNIPQTGAVTGQAMADILTEYLADAASGGNGDIHVNQAITALQNRKRELQQEQKKRQNEKSETNRQIEFEISLLSNDCRNLREKLTSYKSKKQSEGESLIEIYQNADTEGEEKKGTFVRIGGIIGVCILLTVLSTKMFDTLVGVITGAILTIILAVILVGRKVQSVLKEKKNNKKEQEVKSKEISESKEISASEVKEEVRAQEDEFYLQMCDMLQEKELRLFNLQEQQLEIRKQTTKDIELSDDIQALELAASELEKLSQSYYEDIEDELNGEISRWVSLLTAGAYDSVRLEAKGKLLISTNGKEVPPTALSRGTLEQIFLALRLAVGSVVSKEEDLPIFFDEAFAMYDDERLAKTLQALDKTGKQILIFTCQKREREILKKLEIPYHNIELL